MPGTQRSVQIDGRMMEAELRALPRSQREQMLREMPRILQERINHGFEIYSGVQNGTIHGPARPEDIRDLMTFLTAKAMERGDGFSEGAFNIEDPGHRLKHFLDSCPEGYNRASSHIDGFQAGQGGGHRGIDLGLPYGKHTLLYGAMNKGMLGLGEDRLFLKMEEHGCRLLQRDPQGAPPSRPWHLRDIGDFLGHAAGYFKTVLRTISGGKLFPNARDSRKERIPSDISRDFKSILKHLDRTGQGRCAALLRENTPLAKAQGIRTLFFNLSQAVNAPDLHLDQETRTMLTALWDKLAARYDHLDVRIGNEIVLDKEELSPPSHLPPHEMMQRAAVQNATALLKTAVASLLEVRDPQHVTSSHVEQFTRALTKMAMTFSRGGGGPEVRTMIERSVHDGIQILSPSQKEHLRALLAHPRLRGGMAAINEAPFASEIFIRAGITDTMMEGGVAVAQRAVRAYLTLCEGVGFDPQLDDLQPAEEDREMATSLLVSAGSDLEVSEKTTQRLGYEAAMHRLREEQVGLMRIDDIRRQVGPGVHAIGTDAEAIFHSDRVNEEGIHQRITNRLAEYLITRPDHGIRGLNSEFVVDFLRNGITVNGQRFGATGTNILQQAQEEEVQRFIDAVGGYEKARQIAHIAHQGAFAILMLDGLQPDPGFQEVFATYSAFPGQPVGHDGPQSFFSLDVQGDNITLRCENRQQKVNEEGREMGLNLFLQVRLEGVGTNEVGLSLDRWDAVVSSRSRE